MNDKIARASLHVEVADRVRDMIFDRTLPPGYRIEELDLSAKLGTSRTPLREALKVLANEGLVRLAPGRGAFVTELTPPEVDSLFPVLAMLEGRCASEAVRRMSPADLRRLQAVQQRMEERVAASDAIGYHDATDALHRMLQTIAGNPWLARIATDLRRFLRLARGMVPPSESRLLQSLAEHRTLLKTIVRGDAEGAEQVMQHHLLAQQKAWRAAQLQALQAARQNGAASANASAVAAAVAAGSALGAAMGGATTGATTGTPASATTSGPSPQSRVATGRGTATVGGLPAGAPFIVAPPDTVESTETPDAMRGARADDLAAGDPEAGHPETSHREAHHPETSHPETSHPEASGTDARAPGAIDAWDAGNSTPAPRAPTVGRSAPTPGAGTAVTPSGQGTTDARERPFSNTETESLGA